MKHILYGNDDINHLICIILKDIQLHIFHLGEYALLNKLYINHDQSI